MWTATKLHVIEHLGLLKTLSGLVVQRFLSLSPQVTSVAAIAWDNTRGNDFAMASPAIFSMSDFDRELLSPAIWNAIQLNGRILLIYKVYQKKFTPGGCFGLSR